MILNTFRSFKISDPLQRSFFPLFSCVVLFRRCTNPFQFFSTVATPLPLRRPDAPMAGGGTNNALAARDAVGRFLHDCPGPRLRCIPYHEKMFQSPKARENSDFRISIFQNFPIICFVSPKLWGKSDQL